MLRLHQTQTEVAKNIKRFRVLCCGRRWGKTTLAAEEIKGKLLSKTSRILYIAPTYQQARDIAWSIFKQELRDFSTNINESRLELITKNLKQGESHLFLRGWEAIETLRGQQFDFIVIDEVASMRNYWINWQEVIRPTLTDTKGEAMFISTPRGFNHFYDLYNKEKEDEDYKSFNYTTFDNPYINKDEIEKARKELTEDRFAQEYLADFRKTEGLVYKEFNRDEHLFDSKHILPEFKDIICGVDFGFTNPAAVLKIGVDRDNHFWVLDEWYKTGQTTSQIIEVVKGMGPHKVYPDPAEPDRILEMEKKGLNIRKVSKDIVNGIDTVREYFKQGRIKIHRQCSNFIHELETYRYPEKKPDHNEKETPIKEFDHCCDSLRYSLYSYEPIQPMIQKDYDFGLYSTDYC